MSPPSSPTGTSTTTSSAASSSNRRCVPLDFFDRHRPWLFHQQAFARGTTTGGCSDIPVQLVLPGDKCLFGLPLKYIQKGPYVTSSLLRPGSASASSSTAEVADEVESTSRTAPLLSALSTTNNSAASAASEQNQAGPAGGDDNESNDAAAPAQPAYGEAAANGEAAPVVIEDVPEAPENVNTFLIFSTPPHPAVYTIFILLNTL